MRAFFDDCAQTNGFSLAANLVGVIGNTGVIALTVILILLMFRKPITAFIERIGSAKGYGFELTSESVFIWSGEESS